MTVPSKITLYDAEFTAKGKTVSPYSRRVTLLLDYKKISYEIAYINFRDIESTAKAVGALPTFTNGDGTPGYTIPFVVADFAGQSPVAISDSVKIANFIEEAYPDPEGKLIPSNTRFFQSLFTKYVGEKLLGSVSKIVAPFIANALEGDNRKRFIDTRKNATGYTLDQIAPQDPAGIAQSWKTIEAAFDDLAAHLDAVNEGNFRVTGGPSYSEFELVSVLHLVKQLSPDAWKRLESRNGGRWAKLLDLPLYKNLPANQV